MNSAAFETQDAGLQLVPSGHARPGENDTARWTTLLNRIAENDVDACATFYDESCRLTFSLVMHILQDREAAEEALLDLYLQVWTRARLRADQTRNPMTWLIGLARKTALARLPQNRQSSNRAQLPSLAPAPQASVLAFEPLHRDRHQVSRGLR